jgi:O-acetyl-ADP-ribose deacetylase (regulator of RNase III)/NAD-dependent SIR2 family protein deacetylase
VDNNTVTNTSSHNKEQPCQLLNNQTNMRDKILQALQAFGYTNDAALSTTPTAQLRDLLRQYIISSNHYTDTVLELMDDILNDEELTAPEAAAAPVPSNYHPKIFLFRGSITTLKVDAIVNAANASGTGCFQPNHVCIDNILHTASGPRLRVACQEAMKQRGSKRLLESGTGCFMTPSFHLPHCEHVVHVTGPCLPPSSVPTTAQKNNLHKSYTDVLDVCAASQLKSVSFCCLSTGLFNYPSDLAAHVALNAVKHWLLEHDSNSNKNGTTTLEQIIFTVFTDKDQASYEAALPIVFESIEDAVVHVESKDEQDDIVNATAVFSQNAIVAGKWIQNADCLIICAGAGMSWKPASNNEGVYADPMQFKFRYPFMLKYGYKTCYDAMGLAFDSLISEEIKWGFWVQHYWNLRYEFAPNDGYNQLFKLIGNRDYFVLTSNVDGCFVRTKGFDTSKIYTPQGDIASYQCCLPCSKESVFASYPLFVELRSKLLEDGSLPPGTAPTCPKCGGKVFMNLRMDGAFIHKQEYDQSNRDFETFVETAIENKHRVVVVEIGAGFNTPTVTRYPMECLIRRVVQMNGMDCGKLIRINPGKNDEYQVPQDLPSLGVKRGWDFLMEIGEVVEALKGGANVEEVVMKPVTGALNEDMPDYRDLLRRLRK